MVEMDGSRFHKSLEAFKNDRKRQNLLTANGFLVFRTFAKEVLDEGERHALVELIAETAEKTFSVEKSSSLALTTYGGAYDPLSHHSLSLHFSNCSFTFRDCWFRSAGICA
ncbi:DUF559 domain-containing protein [Metapseudomonas otitidis]|uniref:DUF559 domain-containing protein n=1 Tax=Metapseudomonas otitidis TaxID=319939 RepID=UPI0023F9B72C|nr:DUF559 domain-containing protein [Pseudomonas otitidis]